MFYRDGLTKLMIIFITYIHIVIYVIQTFKQNKYLIYGGSGSGIIKIHREHTQNIAVI